MQRFSMMRLLFVLLFIPILISCSRKADVSADNFAGIGSLGYHKDIEVSKESYFRIPAFDIFIFQYHDSIYVINLDSLGNSHCKLITCSLNDKKTADNIFARLHDQTIPLEKYKGACMPDLIHLSSIHGKTQFGGAHSTFDEIFAIASRSKQKEIEPSKQPPIFQAKIYEFDSRYLRHYFSDAYLYKDLRVTRYVHGTK